MTPLPTTLRKIHEFASLPTGWRYGRGGAVASEVVDQALFLYGYLVQLGFTTTDAFATDDGGIMVAAYKDSHQIEIAIGSDLQISVVHDINDREQLSEERQSRDAVIKTLLKIARNVWNISDSSTPKILPAMKAGSKVVRSLISTEASQSFVLIVFSNQETRSVPTLGPITYLQPTPISLSSGNLMIPSYRVDAA